MQVDTTTKNNKNYLNQQLKQLFSTTFARATTQHALKKNNKNCYKKTTQTISRLKAKTTWTIKKKLI